MKWLDPIRPYFEALRLLAWIAIILAAYLYGRADGKAAERDAFDAYKAKVQSATLKASEAARTAEKAQAIAFNKYDTQYQEGLARARKEGFESVVSGVLSGGIRLRGQWACPVSGATVGAGEPDASVRERAESAARIVLAAAECDAQVTALQNVLLEERKGK